MEEFELENGEIAIRSIRQHVFVLALKFIPLVILAFLPFFGLAFISFFAQMNPGTAEALAQAQIPEHTVRFFTGVWLLGILTAAFSIFTRYYLTVWVITNMRIVDINQYGFFSRKVSSFLLIRVQDVTTEVSGLLGTLIGFGRLSVQTAGNDEDFNMEGIAHPAIVRDVIMSQVTQLHHSEMQSGGM